MEPQENLENQKANVVKCNLKEFGVKDIEESRIYSDINFTSLNLKLVSKNQNYAYCIIYTPFIKIRFGN